MVEEIFQFPYTSLCHYRYLFAFFFAVVVFDRGPISFCCEIYFARIEMKREPTIDVGNFSGHKNMQYFVVVWI